MIGSCKVKRKKILFWVWTNKENELISAVNFKQMLDEKLSISLNVGSVQIWISVYNLFQPRNSVRIQTEIDLFFPFVAL